MKTIEKYKNSMRGRYVYRLEFDSVVALREECLSSNFKKNAINDPSWWGGDSIDTLLNKCLSGDERYIKQAEDLLDYLREEIEIPRPAWQASSFGAFPVVADYLAGEIDCLRYLHLDNQQTTPVKIWYDPTSSAVISADDLIKRGTAVLALCMALSQIRPIELWTFSDIDAYSQDHALICTKIATNPMMLAEACFALCNPGFARGIVYNLAKTRMDFNGLWGFGDYCDDFNERVEVMKKSLKASDLDIIIPGAQYKDELIKDPLSWVKREIRRHCTEMENV